MNRAQFREKIREIITSQRLSDTQREQHITAAADAYAAHMIEQHCRPDAIRGAA